MINYFKGEQEAGVEVRKYRYATVAYICIETDKLYIYAHKYSTAELRENYFFGLQEKMEPVLFFDRQKDIWKPTKRRMSNQEDKRG